MNGYELCEKAYIRLGFNNKNTFSPHSSTSKRDLEFVNQILEDLRLNQLKELSCKVECSKEQAEAVCSGVAMLLSMCEGETEKNRLYTAVYNAKRAAVLGNVSKIEDTLPKAESGEV